MKGARLHISILSKLAITLAIIMTVLNLYDSWSQYARSIEEPILFACLSAISTIFIIRSFTHKEIERVLYKLVWDVKLKHINRYTGYFFIGVLCTPVTHPEWWIETLHFIFTALAVGTAYSEILHWKENKYRLLYIAFGLVGFTGGFVFRFYSVGLGELLAAIPILIHITTTNRE